MGHSLQNRCFLIGSDKLTPAVRMFDAAIDLVRNLIVVDPTKRLDVNAALQHPWVLVRFTIAFDSKS